MVSILTLREFKEEPQSTTLFEVSICMTLYFLENTILSLSYTNVLLRLECNTIYFLVCTNLNYGVSILYNMILTSKNILRLSKLDFSKTVINRLDINNIFWEQYVLGTE